MIRAIEIKVREGLTTKMGRLAKIGLGRKACKALAKEMVIRMKGQAPVWSGALRASIQSRPTNVGYNITMLGYGEYQEFGTAAGYWTNSFRFQAWSASKGFKWGNVQVGVFLHGTKAHPFVRPVINAVMGNFENIQYAEMKTVFQECGFKH